MRRLPLFLVLAASPAIGLVFPDAGDYTVAPGAHGGIYTGVGVTNICSASLLWSGLHILTAAHCSASTQVRFDWDGGSVTIPIVTFYSHPDFSTVGTPGDIGVGLLAFEAPVQVTRYTLYREFDELGQTADILGYGSTGTGLTGATGGFGTLRRGDNLYEATSGGGTYLIADFDNGLDSNDALQVHAGFPPQLGIPGEVMIAPGDSGGPAFLAGRIAGVHSFRGRFDAEPDGSLSDIDSVLNSSFGEVFGSTRVSVYAGWVDAVVTPEPGTLVLWSTGLLALIWLGRRTTASSATGRPPGHTP
ncbi:MAG: trypsin-like serine protease [Bryobacterales bacterium]|nr:trypsin-like serine protease [Bryobacterales bacterium]